MSDIKLKHIQETVSVLFHRKQLEHTPRFIKSELCFIKINKRMGDRVQIKTESQIENRGQMKGVSDDGSAVVTERSKQFDVYFLKEGELQKATFKLPFESLQSEVKTYREGSNPYYSVQVTSNEQQVIVYVLSKDKKHLAKVNISKQSKQPRIELERMEKEVLDMKINPHDDSLVVIDGKNTYFLFSAEKEKQKMPVPSLKGFVDSGKLFLRTEGEKLYTYLFLLKDNLSFQIYKINYFLNKFIDYEKTHFHLPKASFMFPTLDISAFQYDPEKGLFGIGIDYSDTMEKVKMGIKMFVNKALDVLQIEDFGRATGFFHGFTPGGDRIIFTKYKENDEAIDKQIIREVCLTEYEVKEGKIDLLIEEEVCRSGEYEEVSTKKINNSTNVFLHKDRAAEVFDQDLKETNITISSKDISVKNPNFTINDNYREIELLNQTITGKEQPVDPVAPIFSFFPMIIILFLVIISLLIAGICLWYKSSEKNSEELASSESSITLEFESKKSSQASLSGNEICDVVQTENFAI